MRCRRGLSDSGAAARSSVVRWGAAYTCERAAVGLGARRTGEQPRTCVLAAAALVGAERRLWCSGSGSIFSLFYSILKVNAPGRLGGSSIALVFI